MPVLTLALAAAPLTALLAVAVLAGALCPLADLPARSLLLLSCRGLLTACIQAATYTGQNCHRLKNFLHYKSLLKK